MGRYLVVGRSQPATWEECEKCDPFWKESLSEYGDVTPLRDYGNISEGRYVGIFEASSADRIRLLWDSFDNKIKASGLFPTLSQGWISFEIWPIEIEAEGTNVVYKAEALKV